jgi:7-cyano-7-deazaguanine synthase in queuosine biosynthesis
MNHIKVLLESGNPYNSGSAIFLDINDKYKLQIGFNIEDYTRVRGTFDESAGEFAYFTSVIYACDRSIKREDYNGDRWTREFHVEIPVNNPEKWIAVTSTIEKMVEFLTGDIWHINFVNTTIPLFGKDFKKIRRNFRKKRTLTGKCVSLFSGGLDSLIGVIDWLENNPTESICFASTYDAQAENARNDQVQLLKLLSPVYKDRFSYFIGRTGVCSDGQDTNFRSRSLAFIGNAVLAASFIGKETRIIIPENGAIALNYPLTPARRGSLSTRTVHPYFINKVNDLLHALEFKYTIDNPYKFLTKGEMIVNCKNKQLLSEIFSHSVSCGKRGFDRQYWSNKSAGGCGACVPCIYRRAALLKAGFPEEEYGYDLRENKTWQRDIFQPNSDLQSILDFIEANHTPREIWQNIKVNNLDIAYKRQYVELIQRLRDEVKIWVDYMGLA